MPEKQNVEWKAKWKDNYLAWLCGFANAQGGRLVIGCDDDGEIVGVPNAKKLMEDIPNKIKNAMGIVAEVNLHTKDGKSTITIDVPPYPVGISYKGVYYYRSGSTMQVLTGPALESFLLGKRGVSWDNLPFPSFKMEDVDDRLYMANVGRLPVTWTKENLLGKHESIPYNPNIATVMYDAGFIESWGRGVEKIRSACAAQGVPEPEYTVHPGDIMIKFSAPKEGAVNLNDQMSDEALKI